MVLLVAGLLGCQQPHPTYDVERSRSYAEDKAEVWDEILQFLQANDITVTRSNLERGTIEADRLNYQDAGWAECVLAVRTDRSSDSPRPRRARQRVDRSLSLEIAVREAGGMTTVTLDSTFTERQIHPWRNLPFETGCVSKGVLEKTLLDTIGPPAAATTGTRNPAGTN